MSIVNKIPEVLEKFHTTFTVAPLTEDLSFSYLIEIDQDEQTEYCGVSSIEEAFQTIMEHPYSTATINIGDRIPCIKFRK